MATSFELCAIAAFCVAPVALLFRGSKSGDRQAVPAVH